MSPRYWKTEDADLTVDVHWRDGRRWRYFVGGEIYRDLRGPRLAEIVANEVRRIVEDEGVPK